MTMQKEKIDALMGAIHDAESRAALAWDVMKTSLDEPSVAIHALDQVMGSVAEVASISTMLLSYVWNGGER